MKTLNLKRLYVVTGKGGVGKTTIALALAKSLKEEGLKVFYNSFDVSPSKKLCKSLGVPVLELTVEHSVAVYIARKVGSEALAEWIMKTPFFKSIFAMVPGLAHMILFGHVIDMLEEDPELTIVMDSPASGHVLTMFESPTNFGDIFGQGLIAKDINRMLAFMDSENGLRTIISTLPSAMAVHEGLELEQELKKRRLKDVVVVMNEYLPETLMNIDANKKHWPSFLKRKIELEIEAAQELKATQDKIFPYIPEIETEKIVNSLQKMARGLA